MYFTYDKTTGRFFSFWLTALFTFFLGGAAIATTGILVYNKIYADGNMLGVSLGVLLIWAEFICTIMTFNSSVCDGPNSALVTTKFSF